MNRSLVLSLPLVCASFLAMYACSSSTTAPTTTPEKDSGSSTGVDAGLVCGDAGYACGQPCDKGNSVGVGKFCTDFADCAGNTKATICASLGNAANAPRNQQEQFCTITCTGSATDSGPDIAECGENATCECQGGQCGCTPNYCL